MKEFAYEFYHSKGWKYARDNYIKKKIWCERCLKEGRYNRAEMVHHKIYLTPENINNPNITLMEDNFEALCNDCHNKEHHSKKRRFTIDKDGHVNCNGTD